jgi:hypothetical protein
MNTYQTSQLNIDEDDKNYLSKAVIASLIMHSLCMLVKFEIAVREPDIRDNAIKVDFIAMTIPVKKIEPVVQAVKPVETIAKKIAVEKKPEVVKKVVQQPKVDKGTLKKVVENKALGDRKAPKVQDVQKGDPASKNFTAYKPGTEFRKLKATNIGSGGSAGVPKTITTSGGSGDTYKGLDFATKSLTAFKSGNRFTVKKIDDGGAGAGSGGGIGDGAGKGFGDGTITGTVGGTLQTSKILTNVGSLTGATVGKIDTSRGAEGLSTKGTISLADAPGDTVILGSMDPEVIKRILLDHLAQFRYCYQSELERSNSDKIAGVLNLNFDIGSSGRVQRVNVTGAQSINSNIKGCVAGVLKGIGFPEPQGGGTVEVKQPMNFYSKYN